MRVTVLITAIFIILFGFSSLWADDTQPKGLKAVTGDNAIYLSWFKPDKKVQGYWVYRAIQDGDYQKINTVLLKKNFYKDTNVVNGQLYWYTVTALNKDGIESTQSKDISVTPTARKGSLSGF